MRLMLILWPSFVAAGVAEMIFFNIFDPSDFDAGRLAAYSIAFFGFWSLAAASSALTCFLQRSRDEVNGSPKRPA